MFDEMKMHEDVEKLLDMLIREILTINYDNLRTGAKDQKLV